MFALKSRFLRRRLSPLTSGSARRREHERRQAEQTRAEGERLARDRRDQRRRDKMEVQRQAREDLASYAPWGRAGGGAPNPHGIRFTKIRTGEIYPEDELRGVCPHEPCRRWNSPRRARRIRRTPLRLREDPQICYAENLKESVNNDIRYRKTPDQQKDYKEILDNLVDYRNQELRDERTRDVEYERKLEALDGPWGRPGPGGTTWRNPRNVGLNFAKSMGWTDNEIFGKLKGEHQRQKRSSLALPIVKRDDESDKGQKPSSVGRYRLPDISYKPNSKEGSREGSGRINKIATDVSKEKTISIEHKTDELTPKITSEQIKTYTKNLAKKRNEIAPRTKETDFNRNWNNNRYGMYTKETAPQKKSPKKKFIKRMSNGRRVKKVDPEEFTNIGEAGREVDCSLKKYPTPEETIMTVTGGVELVPLLARRRAIGARTLHSSDVTRPPEQNCQWREMVNMDYLKELKKQMQVKCVQKEEKRLDSAESVRQHHATWDSLWGRPGHGAPQQRGRYARNNLAKLLYVAPHLVSNV